LKKRIIFGRGILHSSHFTEFQESGRFFHGGHVLRFAGGLELLQHGQVLLNRPVQALLAEREELELLRLEGEDTGCGQGRIDLIVLEVKSSAVFVESEGEEIVLDGADPPTKVPPVAGTPRG
jgi:hypothetical protein